MLGFTLHHAIHQYTNENILARKKGSNLYIYDHFVCIGNLILTVTGRLFFIIKIPNKILASLTISMQ